MPWRLNAVQACKEGYFQSGLHTTHAHMDGGGVEKTHNKLKKYTFLHIPLVILQMYDYKMHADIHAQQHTYTEKKTKQQTTFVSVTSSPEFAYDYCEI